MGRGCCGQAGPEEVLIKVKLDHWRLVNKGLEDWLETNRRIENGDKAAEGDICEIEGELAEAVQHLVENAVPVELTDHV